MKDTELVELKHEFEHSKKEYKEALRYYEEAIVSYIWSVDSI